MRSFGKLLWMMSLCHFLEFFLGEFRTSSSGLWASRRASTRLPFRGTSRRDPPQRLPFRLRFGKGYSRGHSSVARNLGRYFPAVFLSIDSRLGWEIQKQAGVVAFENQWDFRPVGSGFRRVGVRLLGCRCRLLGCRCRLR